MRRRAGMPACRLPGGDSTVSFIDRIPPLAALNYAKGQVLHRLGLRGHLSGTTASQRSPAEAAAYYRAVVQDYIIYGAGGDPARLQGLDILEIGPGDNLGVALLLLAHGAGSVTAIDGFDPPRSDAHNARVYRILLEGLGPDMRERLETTGLLAPGGSLDLTTPRLRAFYRTPIHEHAEPLASARYDLILSRAVLEHVAGLEAGWQAMTRALRPQGAMWHKVDFRNHKFFSEIHPLYFLTVPPRRWNWISSPDPTLNRLRLPAYRRLSARDFATTTLYFTHILDEPELLPHPAELIPDVHYSRHHLDLVRAVRPRLCPAFRDHNDEDLLVTGVFLISERLRAAH